MTSIDITLPAEARRGQYGVYVLFGGDGEVLYIGCTKDLPTRLRGHRHTAPWFRQIRSIEFTPCDGLHEARALEKSMIAAFHPESNTNDFKPVRGGRHPLPDWTVALLVEMFEAERAAGARREVKVPEREALNGYIVALRDAGWPLSSIGFALGMSREAVRLRQNDASGPLRTLDVPSLPIKPPKAKKVRPVVPDAVLREMRHLLKSARKVNGVTPLDHPSRVATVRLSELIADQVTSGVTISCVARQLGLTPSAVAFRLVRHGYHASTSESPCYQTYGAAIHPRLSAKEHA